MMNDQGKSCAATTGKPAAVNSRALLADLEALGVEPGMNLMVHSSLRAIGPVEGGAEAVLEVLLRAIGPGGTLMMPTVSGSVRPDQPVFHPDHTPSTVGYLTNLFRVQPGVLRSRHPVHSIAAGGPRAGFFTGGHSEANTPWSPETPFGRMMRDDDCALLFLGVGLNYNSCFHALEIEARLPGMHTAWSTGLVVVEADGATRRVEHHWHDARTKRYFADSEHLLRDRGCLAWGRTGRGVSRLVRAVPMRRVILELLAGEPWLMTRPPEDNDFIWEP